MKKKQTFGRINFEAFFGDDIQRVSEIHEEHRASGRLSSGPNAEVLAQTRAALGGDASTNSGGGGAKGKMQQGRTRLMQDMMTATNRKDGSTGLNSVTELDGASRKNDRGRTSSQQLEVDAALMIKYGHQLAELEEHYGVGSTSVERGMTIAYFMQQAEEGEGRQDAREVAERLMSGASLEAVLLGEASAAGRGTQGMLGQSAVKPTAQDMMNLYDISEMIRRMAETRARAAARASRVPGKVDLLGSVGAGQKIGFGGQKQGLLAFNVKQPASVQ